jgi:hypothetical protein
LNFPLHYQNQHPFSQTAAKLRVDRQPWAIHSPHVTTLKPDRPYFESWLKRTGRQLAVSGRLSQLATVLAAENGGTVDDWRSRLRTLLDGAEVPSLDLLTRIDMLLSGPSRVRRDEDAQQGLLF